MARLIEGQKFPLSSKSENSKSVVFVKLTDSALRSLEEYLKHRAVLDKNGAGGPTIQFTQAGGAISLPSSGERGAVSYNFGLSASEDGGPNKQSSQNLLRATNGSLESVGPMGETLRVKASEAATFSRIEQRIKKDEEYKAKKGTVMLDDKDKSKSKKSKPVVVPRGRTAPLPPPRTSTASLSLPPHPRALSPAGPGRPPHSTQTPRTRPPATSPSPSWRSPGGPPEAQPQGPYVAKNKYGSQHKPSSSKASSGNNPEIMKRSLRERLVHLLAVRAQKKMELHTRIYKDGMKEKDKKSNLLSMLLREVAECKNNVYELKRAMWNDVNEDWPFYTVEDRAALKRRKPQNLTPPGSDTGSTSSGHSPSSTNPASPPQIQCGIKRYSTDSQSRFCNSGELLSAPPSNKKIRVSSYKRPGESSGPHTKSPHRVLSSGHHTVSPRGLSFDTTHDSSRLELGSFSGDACHDDSAPDWGQFHDDTVAVAPPPAPVRGPSPGPLRREKEERHRSPGPEERRSPELEEEERGAGGQGPMQLTQNTNKDFTYDFSAIVSASQRTEFKAVYNQSYTKYRQLHQVLDDVSKRADLLAEELKRVNKGSREYKLVKSKIKAEFQRCRTDPSCQEAYSTFQYLHEKLAHIKKLVHDYDQARLAGR